LPDIRFGSKAMMSALPPKADIVRYDGNVRFDSVHRGKFSRCSIMSSARARKEVAQRGRNNFKVIRKKRRDPLYRERERIAVRERMRQLRAARRRQASGHRTAAARIRNKASRARVSMWVEATAHYSGQGMGVELSSVVLTPVRQADYWRVKIAWSKTIPRYFGKFHSQTEAEKWIEEHHWLTEQRQEPDVAPA
jgi:hypothetical protein